MLRTFRILTLSAVVAVSVFSASVALAAPVPWESIDVAQHAEQDGGVLLVSGQLPESATLPAEAELAVPAGSQIQWIGEILGGAASADPALEHTMRTVAGSDIYRFTLKKARVAQIEVPLTTGQTFDGSTYASAVKWTADQAVPSVRMSLRVPAGAQVASGTAGGELLPGDASWSFYSKSFTGVKAGDQLGLDVTYGIAPALAKSTAPTQPGGSSSLIPVLIVLAGIAGAVALVVAVRRKIVAGGAGEDESEDPEPAQATTGKTPQSRTTEALPDEDGSEPARTGMSGGTKRGIVTAGIIAVLVIAAFVVAGQNSRAKLTGDTISQTFSPGEACQTAQIPVEAKKGADPRATAEKLFSALQPMTGLKTATYNHKNSTIQIGYCESETSEDAMRQALAPTGLVSATGATPQAQ